MSNMGLEAALKRSGIKMLRAPVGDKYVLEQMLSTGAALGGEQSGHIIFSGRSTTGDGLLTALLVLDIIHRSGKSLAELIADLKTFPQVIVNVKVREKRPFDQIPTVSAAILAAEQALNDSGRVVIRYSGTEALCRVMIEAESEPLMRHHADTIANAIRTELGMQPRCQKRAAPISRFVRYASMERSSHTSFRNVRGYTSLRAKKEARLRIAAKLTKKCAAVSFYFHFATSEVFGIRSLIYMFRNRIRTVQSAATLRAHFRYHSPETAIRKNCIPSVESSQCAPSLLLHQVTTLCGSLSRKRTRTPLQPCSTKTTPTSSTPWLNPSALPSRLATQSIVIATQPTTPGSSPSSKGVVKVSRQFSSDRYCLNVAEETLARSMVDGKRRCRHTSPYSESGIGQLTASVR